MTQLRPYVLQHTEECDLILTGRATLALLDIGPVTRDTLESTLAEYRKGVLTCGCAKLRCLHTQTLIDRAARAGNVPEQLLIERTELRRLIREGR